MLTHAHPWQYRTHAHPWTIILHPCSHKTHGHGWAWAPNVGLCGKPKRSPLSYCNKDWRDWLPVTIRRQALSLVEKAAPVQFATSHYAWGTDGVSMWMRDGCEVYMIPTSTNHQIVACCSVNIGILNYYLCYENSHMASNGSCFMVTPTIFQKPPLESRPSTKPGDHGTPNAHNCWFILCIIMCEDSHG